ncbi:tetrathionate reductase family octaheme c-type cytochrome [Desulfatiferula olefinivorans]
MLRWMLTALIGLCAAGLAVPDVGWSLDEETAPGRTMARTKVDETAHWNTTDHSKHERLNQAFTSGPEVTRACLSCHTEAALQFHRTIHWTWLDPNTRHEEKQLGKGGLSLNNFCISIHSNEPRCTSCHAGYGWADKTFDFTDQSRVDCLVCHEQTGTYKKYPTKAGYPVDRPTVFPENKVLFQPPDYAAVARSVSLPGRNNCGVCHFYGGGGDGVKHGDLDSSLFKPSKSLDVHMGIDGQDFSCTRCHTTTLHNIAGRVYNTPAAQDRQSLVDNDLISKITCESCHTATPHKKNKKANDHTDKVACQSCHIPSYARVNPTKMWWDWSRGGDLKDGKPYEEKGLEGKVVYTSKKGEMRWDRNVEPEYFWFNGSIRTLTVKDTVDPTDIVKVNEPLGRADDKHSRIFPFKVHRGRQPYDKVNKNLVIPHLFPAGPDDKAAYWKGFDWASSIKTGMAAAGQPYSGEYGFVETSYVYPITHMVAPAEDAVSCTECHRREGSRMMSLSGFYMPGRDHETIIDRLGWGILSLSLAGVLLHALGRVVSRLIAKEEKS